MLTLSKRVGVSVLISDKTNQNEETYQALRKSLHYDNGGTSPKYKKILTVDIPNKITSKYVRQTYRNTE